MLRTISENDAGIVNDGHNCSIVSLKIRLRMIRSLLQSIKYSTQPVPPY